jgi:hypothetical protein
LQMNLAFKEKEFAMKERELALKEQSDMFNRQLQQETARFDQGLKHQDFEDRRQASQFDRQSAMEDRQFQRSVQERELAGKDQERAMKGDEMAYRRQMDADNMKGPDGKSARDTVMASVESLVQQVSQAIGQLSEQQMVIAQALQGIAAQQDETTEALTAVVSHMTAPVSVKRDPKTRRAIGVERGQNDAADMKAMLEKLAKGRNMVRGADNRVEALA